MSRAARKGLCLTLSDPHSERIDLKSREGARGVQQTMKMVFWRGLPPLSNSEKKDVLVLYSAVPMFDVARRCLASPNQVLTHAARAAASQL